MSEEYKVLVTGGAGLLGSHFAEYLLNKGHQVTCIDNLSGGYIENIDPRSTFYPVDLTDTAAISEIMQSHKFDFVYHFAAYAAVGLSPFIRKFNYSNNIIASINLINGSIKNNVKKFVFASSMDVYGEQEPPFYEHFTPKPEDPYGIAKYAVELDLNNAYKQFGLKYTIIRPHNIIGPRQNIWDRYRNVAGIWIRQAMAGEKLTIYGDGEQRRAFSDIKCYMDPFYQLMANPDSDQQIINIGADSHVSINLLANIVADVAHEKTSIRPPCVYLEARDEVSLMWCNHDKAENILGFKDKTNLYNLISETWDWAIQIKPKEVKYMEYEIEKNMYKYWRKDGQA
jgi:UDP-glucose 4-epimerase